MKNKLGLLIFVFFILFAVLAGFWQSSRQHATQVELMRDLLGKIRQNGSPPKFYEHKCRQLKNRLIGMPFGPEAVNILKMWRNNVPGVKIYSMLYDSDSNPFSSGTSGFTQENEVKLIGGSGTTRFPFDEYHKKWFSYLQLPFNTAWKSRLGGINRNFSNLRIRSQGRPNKFYYWNEGLNEHGMGIWDFKKQSGINEIAGILLFLTPNPDMERALFSSYVENSVKRGFAIGYFDQISPDSMLSLPGIPESTCFRLQKNYVNSGLDTFKVGRETVVFVPVSESGVLAGRIHAPDPKIQPQLLFLAFLLLPIFLRLRIDLELHRPSIIVLLIVLLVFSGVFPMMISVFFWQNLEKNRFQAVLNREGARLLDLLTCLDRNFFTTIQIQERRYRDWKKRFQLEYRKNPRTYSIRSSEGIGRFFGDFPENSAISKLIDQTKSWDREGSFDSFTLVSSSGVFLRENSIDKSGVRKIAGYPIEKRLRYVNCAAERGSIFPAEILPDLLERAPQDFAWKDWVNLGSGMSERSTKLGSQIFQATYSRMNSEFRTGKDSESRESNSVGLLLDSIQGIEGLDYGKWMNSTDGEMKTIQKNDRRQSVWLGNVKAPSGENYYGITFFHRPLTLEQVFLKGVFDAEAKWPRNIRFYALALDSEGKHFPKPFLHRFFSPLIRSIVPPGVSLVRFIKTKQGEKRLLAILRCPKTLGYALAATVPLDRLTREMAALHLKLVYLGILMGIIIFTLGTRLTLSAVNPVHSLTSAIDAMETNSHDFRVRAKTGDEWEEIAEIFNQSLAGMAELEAARIVQQKLFPKGVIENESYSFVGENIMLSVIGGDYFDCEVTDDNRIMFIFGDVSGHGVSAALVMAIAKSGFSSFIHYGERSPVQMLKNLNDLLFRVVKRRRVMTCTVGIAHPDGTVVLANAGQFPPYFVPSVPGFPDFKVFGSVPVGSMKEISPAKITVNLTPGSNLVFYSDGVIEAVNQKKEPFDLGNLQEALAASTDPSPGGLISAVHRRLRAYTKGVPWEDDVSVAVLTRKSTDR